MWQLSAIEVIATFRRASLTRKLRRFIDTGHRSLAKKIFSAQTVEVGDLKDGGFCVANTDAKLCVYGALPGERVTAMPFSKRSRKIFAHTQEVHDPSPYRVEPPCGVADVCGGCSLQHIATEQQIRYKQDQVQKTFLDLDPALQPEAWFPPLQGDVGGYRAKARLGVKFVDKKQKVLVGFREKHKPFIVESASCHVLKNPVGSMLSSLAELIEGLSTHHEIPQIEVAVGDDETALVFRHLQALDGNDLAALKSFGAKHGVQVYLQPGTPDDIQKIFPDDDVEYLRYHLDNFGLTYEFKPLDFTQVNPSINQQMVAKAVSLLDLKSDDEVLDAFCGIGNFSLALARVAKHVIGIEAAEQSVIRARHNALLNDLNNCVFIAQDLFAESLEISGLQSINKVLLDPPRSGAEALCKTLATRKVERVVYVSCNPVSLARDAKILVASGYKFEGAGVIDMFPHTNHVESIASFYS